MVQPQNIIDALTDREAEVDAANILAKWSAYLNDGGLDITVSESRNVDPQYTTIVLNLTISITDAVDAFIRQNR